MSLDTSGGVALGPAVTCRERWQVRKHVTSELHSIYIIYIYICKIQGEILESGDFITSGVLVQQIRCCQSVCFAERVPAGRQPEQRTILFSRETFISVVRLHNVRYNNLLD